MTRNESPRYVVAEEPWDESSWGETWDVIDTADGESVGSFAGEDGDGEIDAQEHADELNAAGGTR